MGIKSKNFQKNDHIKIIAFVIVVITCRLITSNLAYMHYADLKNKKYPGKKYKDSKAFSNHAAFMLLRLSSRFDMVLRNPDLEEPEISQNYLDSFENFINEYYAAT